MKRILTSAFCLLMVYSAQAQEEKTEKTPDTTRIHLGSTEMIIISKSEDTLDVEDPEDKESRDKDKVQGHWAGIEFGPTILLNSAMQSSFPDNEHWENDPGKSFSWNFNILEHKFPIYKNYIGITTGLGFNVTGVGLKQNVLMLSEDSLYVMPDTVNTFDKNKLRAFYLTVPLMVDLCTNGDANDNGFFLAAGIIGGLRIGSNVKTVIDTDKRDVKEKTRSTFALEAFRVDAAVKLGYNNWGVFANYSLMPIFDTAKTDAVYPLTFGLSYNF